jgi:hypothetical protein
MTGEVEIGLMWELCKVFLPSNKKDILNIFYTNMNTYLEMSSVFHVVMVTRPHMMRPLCIQETRICVACTVIHSLAFWCCCQNTCTSHMLQGVSLIHAALVLEDWGWCEISIIYTKPNVPNTPPPNPNKPNSVKEKLPFLRRSLDLKLRTFRVRRELFIDWCCHRALRSRDVDDVHHVTKLACRWGAAHILGLGLGQAGWCRFLWIRVLCVSTTDPLLLRFSCPDLGWNDRL